MAAKNRMYNVPVVVTGTVWVKVRASSTDAAMEKAQEKADGMETFNASEMPDFDCDVGDPEEITK